MDTSETYIKMCEKAAKYLPKKEPSAGDYWEVENERYGGKEVMLISGYCTDSGVYGPGVADDGDLGGWNLLCPIYRQDQLQEMVKSQNWTLLYREISPGIFTYAVDSGWSMKLLYHSPEQALLDFVMEQKYGKGRCI